MYVYASLRAALVMTYEMGQYVETRAATMKSDQDLLLLEPDSRVSEALFMRL
jgi:hypothetical protein